MGIDWRHMDKLKRKIIKYFILCAFLLSVTESAYDSTVFDIMLPLLNKTSIGIFFLNISYFLILFLIFVLFAFLFWHLTSKAIDKESRRQLNERNMQYSRICHDLKTPMTSVQGFAAALRDGKIKPEEQNEIFNIIYSKSCYMNELVESLFAYSKLDTDAFRMNCQKTDLGSLVRNLVALNYDEFEKREMDLQLDIPEKPAICLLDEKEMKRSINNLIINAYKHNPNGARILIQVFCRENNVYVVVADNGSPIPQEQEQSIFEPFMCGDEARSSGNGNGLGLTISRIIIRKHGGDLYIRRDIPDYTKGFVVKIQASAAK